MSAGTGALGDPSRGVPIQFARKLLVQIGAFVSLTIVCLALWVVYRTLQSIQLSDVLEQFRALPATSVLLALLLTAGAYFVVTGYDMLALDHVGRPVPYRRAALAGCLANAFGTNLGFAVVTGGAIRYRIYSNAGLSALEIAGVTTMSAVTASLGVGVLLMLSLLFGADEAAASVIHLPLAWKRMLGGLLLAFVVVYLTAAVFRPLSIRTDSWSLRLPSAKTAAAQVALGSIDLMLISAIIYVLLPAYAETSFFAFLGVFALALIAGVASHVPGGIGVFESVMLLGLPEVAPDALLGAILLFRCVYYLVPLSLAAVVLAIHEASMQQVRIERARDTAADWLAEIGPQVMALILIFAGVVLLFSIAVPAPAERLATLGEFLPLPVLEIAHVLAGVTGVGLIFLARGLSLRLEAAYRLAALLLGVGIVTLLCKGLIYEGAAVLIAILIVLFYTRPEFRRDGALFDQGFPTEWTSTLTALLAVTIWLGLLSYKPTEYSHELWWHFDYTAEYARFLRTMTVVLVTTVAIGLATLLRPDPVPDLPHAGGLEQVRFIVKQSQSARANLALLGDKRFLFSDSGKAFIMYRVKGNSWIALGDPVGPAAEHDRLVLTFRGLCDRYGGWSVFYLVDAEGLSLYVDLGLSPVKVGEDARVPLERFSLTGHERSELRKAHDRVLEQGVDFGIVRSHEVPALIPELERVSNDWLAHLAKTERGFSRGFFSPDYVARFPCAVVRQDKRIIAFAVLWVSGGKEELALDLLRYHRDAPKGIMEFMVTELMVGGRARGYRWFDLGLVPLAGHERQLPDPLWQRIGRMMYRQSEHFQDSDSHRRFAAALDPVWRPKYLASPGGLKTTRILRDVASLAPRGQV
ncbi:MAG: bifunctional lysylphosphatidylglycerol flippase/synthetase MprF [Gammaproteobacteria bacterium]|nr:bifunctional lysylphosphatidylglycerol flippase/synthetase MprF [Gammaproteobacteria bacterium]